MSAGVIVVAVTNDVTNVVIIRLFGTCSLLIIDICQCHISPKAK